MKKADKKICILKGDGIGPEIMDQAIKVVHSINKTFGHAFELVDLPFGGVSMDECGIPLTPTVLSKCKESDAILLGAIGDPKYDRDPNVKIRPENGLLELRKALSLYANIRPIQVYPSLADASPIKNAYLKNVDILFVRELTGGIYFGEKKLSDDGTLASDLCQYEAYEIERIAEFGFKSALKRRRKVTLVDKANVLETSRLWRRVVQRMAQQNTNVEVDYMYVDNAAMQLVLNPSQFDVIVTSNMFGDILSDLGSVLGGSIGLLPSSSIGTDNALFEPIHGSYPQAKGKDIANPMAAILSVAMMYDYFDLKEEAICIRKSVEAAIQQQVVTIDLSADKSYSCSSVGDWISEKVGTF